VFGMFRNIIPVEALSEEEGLERGRGRQGLLPDFRLELPSPAVEPELRLAELKICGAVKRWYPRDGNLARRKSGVERRSAVLPEEYRKPLALLDQKYHNTQPCQVGPLERRLQGYEDLQCLVIGAFLEGSKDLHSLLEVLADSKLRMKDLLREDERREEASRVHWPANVRGRGVFRGRGNFVTNL
jgi:hypothetical protein